jgi:hypothetical protein
MPIAESILIATPVEFPSLFAGPCPAETVAAVSS